MLQQKYSAVVTIFVTTDYFLVLFVQYVRKVCIIGVWKMAVSFIAKMIFVQKIELLCLEI